MLKIGIFGGGGLIGKALHQHLSKQYHVVIFRSINMYLKPSDLSMLIEDVDIIVNLAGHPISGRWSDKTKRLIYDSRILTTSNLITAISLLHKKPLYFINASAVGIYADFKICNEDSDHYADNSLAQLVQNWESEVFRLKEFGVKFSVLRLGVVLSKFGGAYKILKKVFSMGLGARFGDGKQGFSFILMDDLIRVVDFVIKERLEGIINTVSPSPVDNQTFVTELARILNKPALFVVPAIFLKILLREGSISLLEGQLVVPSRLLKAGFIFEGNNVTNCLKILEK
jgi:uncharacterized protein (TIGR01777 family)